MLKGSWSSEFPALGLGLGLRTPHFSHILEHKPSVDWFECITENYIGVSNGTGGRPFEILTKIRADYPIVFHGVSLSIGSADVLCEAHLKSMKTLIERFEPSWISDHLCWTGVEGKNLHDLLPLPYTEEALSHVVERIQRVQDYLGRRVAIENVSSYITYKHSHMSEWEFVREVAERADCGLLLDVNNIYVSARNHGFEPKEYLQAIPEKRVVQYHLAGHTDYETHLIDTHDSPVCDAVWELYGEALLRFGALSTLLERDGNIPPFEEVARELKMAGDIQERTLGGKRNTLRNSEETSASLL